MSVIVVVRGWDGAAEVPAVASLRAQAWDAWRAAPADDGEGPGDWVVHLGAADRLRPEALDMLCRAIARDPELDVVHAGWTRAPDPASASFQGRGDLFPWLAGRPAMPLAGCAARRRLVREVGGPGDAAGPWTGWDLWQRLARAGARFGALPATLVDLAPAPALDAEEALRAGLAVIARGHGRDPRVPRPAPEHAEGAAEEEAAEARLALAARCGAAAVGVGRDPEPVLAAAGADGRPELAPGEAADLVAVALPRAAGRAVSDWPALWPGTAARVGRVLAGLDARSRTPLLGRRAETALADRVAALPGGRPLRVGVTFAVAVEATAPIADVEPPAGTERVVVRIEAEGEPIGEVALPVAGGRLTAWVLADAIAAECAWPLLGRLLARTAYRELAIRTEEGGGIAISRGGLTLARGLAEDQAHWPGAHDAVGWAVLLQELWSRPGWPEPRFYDPRVSEPDAPRRDAGDAPADVAIGPPLPHLATDAPVAWVRPTVGGVPLGAIPVAVEGGEAPAPRLRQAVLVAAGLELCRAAVREGIVGRPLDGTPLAARLAAAAATPLRPPEGDGPPRGPRGGEPLQTSAARRAILPGAGPAGGPLVVAPEAAGPPERAGAAPARAAPRRAADAGHPFDRAYFESAFARGDDPWRYESPYERLKYDQTLSVIPADVASALEIGCAEGRFTVRLAPRVGRLRALDISGIALERTAERCAGLGNVELGRLDVFREPLPGRYDLVVCSEILYFAPGRATLVELGDRLARVLVPGGLLVAAHGNMVVDEPHLPGFDWGAPLGAKGIGEALTESGALWLERELHSTLYRIQVMRRRRALRRHGPPQVVEVPHAEPTPEVAELVAWEGGGRRGKRAEVATTARLPILMYHRVAPEGSRALARWRVHPDAFARQMRYLRDAGYRGATLDEWRAAAEARRPLPGRAVLLTFDDGYRDFAEHAWPVLREHGLSALVFLVVDRVGGGNAWDADAGEALPLLGWDEARALRREGAAFGAHSCRHDPLTGLAPAAVAADAARAREAIERELGEPVTSFAYPYGAEDRVVRHVVGACGFRFGLTCEPGPATPRHDLLALPRIEVTGTMGFEDFVAALP